MKFVRIWMMKKRIFYVTLAIITFSCSIMSVAGKGKYKLKKPIFVVAESDSLLFDIEATDKYDSVSFQMNIIESKIGNVSFETHCIEDNGNERVDVHKYGGVYESKCVFHREGCEPSDTLYGWHIPLAFVSNGKKIMVSNEGNILKVFCNCHAKSISLLTLEKKLIAEKTIEGRLTEFVIPDGIKYLTINIQHGEEGNVKFKTNTIFTYPVR